MVRVVDSYDLDDGESTDSSVDIDQTQNVSMAASAAYIPGASLSDKLRLAASKGDALKVHELIHAGAKLDADREGRTALHYAALNGHGEIIQILGDEGADVNARDRLGYTALHRAAAQGHLEVVKVLLSEACMVSQQDEVHGNSPLHEAAWNGYSKTLEVLINHKANVHSVNKAGFSSLHLAAQNGHNQSARVLLYAACNPDLKNNYGDSALHTAARYGHAGVSRILISARCNISQQNKNGDTALHISAALRRRKLSKLLTESGINTSLKNKQNETAVDVARRKEHADIILIITSQSKSKKKKKGKEKKEKGSSQQSSDEKTEKKGLFFKKKSKTKKDQDKENVPVEPRPRAADRDHHSAPSEVSSSDFTSQMAPGELLRGFRQTMSTRTREREHSGAITCGTSTRAPRGPRRHVQGLLSEYTPKQGQQYYKDLAGNLKQGPIGYAPVCNCQPIIKKLEKKIEHDRHNIYDHIDASHKTLNTRIDVLDKRSAQQVYSIDKLTKERLDAERRDRENYVQACLDKDRMEMRDNCQGRHNAMKTELENHVDNRITRFENYYATKPMVNMDPCYWCHENENTGLPHYHQDDMLNHKYMQFDPEEPPPPGKLYKSKSDETLSVASSHHSRKHWKLRTTNTAARDVTDMRLAQVIDRAKRMERKIRSQSTGVRAKEIPPQRAERHRDRDYYSYKDYVEQQRNSRHNSGDNPGRVSRLFRDSSRDRLNDNNDNAGTQSMRRQRSASQVNELHLAQNHAFNGQNHGVPRRSAMDLHDKEPPRVRSSSATRELDTGVNLRGSNTAGRMNFDQRPTSVYNSNSEQISANPSMRPVSVPAPNSGHLHGQQQQQQIPNVNHVPNNEPMQKSTEDGVPSHVANPSSGPTYQTPSQRWNPLHTSSPDYRPPGYRSPDTSLSAMSSQNSTPLFPSPTYPAMQKQRSESSSNPDSGYGSRLFGARQISGPQLASSTSSFQSSQGHGNSSLGTSNTSQLEGTTSPIMQYSHEPRSVTNQARPGQRQNVGPQQSLSKQAPPQPHQPTNSDRWRESRVSGQSHPEGSRGWSQSRPVRSSSQPPRDSRQGQLYPSSHDSGRNIIGKATQV